MTYPYSFQVVDYKGQEIKVDTKVKYGDIETQIGIVTEITEPDVDYDDEKQRAVQIFPEVTVTFANGDTDKATSYNITHYTWADYPDGARCEKFMCDDLEVIT